MTDQDKPSARPEADQALLKWVEPEVRTLDIKETAAEPHRGVDGGHVDVDCTRS